MMCLLSLHFELKYHIRKVLGYEHIAWPAFFGFGSKLLESCCTWPGHLLMALCSWRSSWVVIDWFIVVLESESQMPKVVSDKPNEWYRPNGLTIIQVPHCIFVCLLTGYCIWNNKWVVQAYWWPCCANQLCCEDWSCFLRVVGLGEECHTLGRVCSIHACTRWWWLRW